MATLADGIFGWGDDGDGTGSDDADTGDVNTGDQNTNTDRLTLLNRLTAARTARAWILSVLIIGLSFEEALAKLDGGQTALEILFNEFIFANILKPLGESLYDAVINTVEALMIMLFGTNFRIGAGESGVFFTNDGTVMESVKIGLVDIPVYIMSLIADGIVSTVSDLTGFLDQINQGVANAIAPAGIFAPPLVAMLWGVQIVAAVWLITLVVKAIDIPGIRAVPIVETVLAPFRAIGGLLFGR